MVINKLINTKYLFIISDLNISNYYYTLDWISYLKMYFQFTFIRKIFYLSKNLFLNHFWEKKNKKGFSHFENMKYINESSF